MVGNVIFNNKSIHYKREGNGKPIVLLHGFLESLEMWDNFTKTLSKGFTVIRIDLPGFGNSESISNINTMELMADTVNAVMDQEQIKSAVIVGHSMGGYTAMAFADKFPDKLKGLCLFHSHAAADSEEAKTNRERTIEIVEQNHVGFISNFISDLFAPTNIQKFKLEIDLLKTQALKTSMEGVVSALKGMKSRTGKFDLLEKTNVPVLFIAGKKDKRIPADTIMQQALLPHHSEVLLLENVGHMGYIEAKKETLESLRCFVNKCY
ncbi:MAG: alpha/beta hydrolase [Bacteroidetes bacterium]|nr:MAG: alpha/beta hydrolase [Bacteroidota bacterium]